MRGFVFNLAYGPEAKDEGVTLFAGFIGRSFNDVRVFFVNCELAEVSVDCLLSARYVVVKDKEA
jgi:hypothetical protein